MLTLKKQKQAKLFDPKIHGFNPLPMTYRQAREFASIVFGSALSPVFQSSNAGVIFAASPLTS